MESTKNVNTYPMARFETAVIEAHGCMIIRPWVLPAPDAAPDEAVPTNWYAVSPALAHELISKMSNSLQLLRTAASPDGARPQH